MAEDNLKWCPNCEKLKPKTEFYKNRRRPDGLQSICKECQKRTLEQKERRSRLEEFKGWAKPKPFELLNDEEKRVFLETERALDEIPLGYDLLQIRKFENLMKHTEIEDFIKKNAHRYKRGIFTTEDLHNIALATVLAEADKPIFEIKKSITRCWERIRWHERKHALPYDLETLREYRPLRGLFAFVNTPTSSLGTRLIIRSIVNAKKLIYNKPAPWGWDSLNVTSRKHSYYYRGGKKMKDFIEPVTLPEDLMDFLEYDPNDSDEKLLRRTVARTANKHKLSRKAANQVFAQLKNADFVRARVLMYSFMLEWEQWEKKYSEEQRKQIYQMALRTVYYLMGRHKLEKVFRKIALYLPSLLESFAKMGEKLEAHGVKLPSFDELPAFRQEPIKMTMPEVTWLFFRRIDLSKRPSDPLSEEEQAKYAKLAFTMMG